MEPGAAIGEFRLVLDRASQIEKELTGRAKTFTPTWGKLSAPDPGFAVLRVFASLLETVAVKANRLPEKAKVEFLSLAGTSPNPASPAKAILEFEVSKSAERSTNIPQ